MPLAVLQTRKQDGKNPSTSGRAKDIVDAFRFRNFEMSKSIALSLRIMEYTGYLGI